MSIRTKNKNEKKETEEEYTEKCYLRLHRPSIDRVPLCIENAFVEP